MVACESHKLKVGGSNPSVANMNGEITVGIDYVTQAILAYKKNMAFQEKSSDEKKDEEVKVKPILESHLGNNIDYYA